ncbi:TfoX/Sxy family protein [Patescibacteria group bacterium]|nr:TfoX/Sxy family protein [Patescibacteria group bacterium]
MGKDDSFHDYVMMEVFRDIDGITSKHMFGGWGIYLDGVFFALIGDGQIFFKVDESNRSDYEKHGSKPFVYTGHKGKDVTLSYWELPAEIMEDRDELEKWIEKSVKAQINSKNK